MAMSSSRSGAGELIAVAVVATFILSTFAALPNAKGAEDEYYTIGVGTVLEPDDFNPFSMTTGISYTILWLTCEFLYTAGPDIGPYPQLAQSHSVSGDGKVWTYNLYEDSWSSPST
jgi:ABC-type transport system substrate-binding protein